MKPMETPSVFILLLNGLFSREGAKAVEIREAIDRQLMLLQLAMQLGDETWADEIKVKLTELTDTKAFLERERPKIEKRRAEWGYY